MKRAILFGALILILFQPALQAQEREPLAMRIVFEWTVAGALLGAAVGFALWLTDPGNPSIKLASQMAQGAALGTAGGSAYGIYILQRSAQIPIQPLVLIKDPLDPSERLTTDPMVSLLGESGPMAFAMSPGGGGGFVLQLLHFRF